MLECYLCGSKDKQRIHKGVRGNPTIDVLRCNHCGLVWLSDFLQDSDEYYKTSQMRKEESEADLKAIRVTAEVDDRRRFEFISRMIENSTYLDFGCGAGGVLTLVQHKASNVYGVELETVMCDALNSEGIKCYPSLGYALKEQKGMIDVVSMFHVLEHLENPIEYLQDVAGLLSDNGKIVIEIPNADDALLSLYESEDFADFTYWESHLYLYNNQTLKKLMNKAGLRVQFLGQIQRYPLSNTMYWLTKGKPGGHKEWAMLSNERLDKEYESVLARLGIADTIMCIVKKY